MDEDSQAKGARGKSFLLRRLVTGLLRLFSHKSTPPWLRPLRALMIVAVGVAVAVAVAAAFCALLSCVWALSCRGAFGAAPGSCSGGGIHGPRKMGQEAGVGAGGDEPPPVIRQAQRNVTSPIGRMVPPNMGQALADPGLLEEAVPVVQFYSRPGALACGRKHYIARTLQQARRWNDQVYFIGPPECAAMAAELGVTLEPYGEYREVLDRFERELGRPVGYQVRWFVLRAFMERHSFHRIFYLDSDVLLFANVTEMARMLFPSSPMVLSVRWPSLRPPLGPSQYASTAVSGHVSLWTHAALVDFLEFFTVFVQRAVLSGKPGDKGLVELKAYNDMVMLGWYTFKSCWMPEPRALHPPCTADKASGVTAARAARLRGLHTPRFEAESFCTPRRCNATRWADDGWCVFDNNFSVVGKSDSPTRFFRYRPDEGMKCPTSMHYTHFQDWQKEPQAAPVQFLGVHFQAHKKGYLTRGDDPATTWGSSVD